MFILVRMNPCACFLGWKMSNSNQLVIKWLVDLALCCWRCRLLAFTVAESAYATGPMPILHFCYYVYLVCKSIVLAQECPITDTLLLTGQVILSTWLFVVSFAIDALWWVLALTCDGRNFILHVCSHRSIHSPLTWIHCHQPFSPSSSKS